MPDPVPADTVPAVVEDHLRREESALLAAVDAAAAAVDAPDPRAELTAALEDAGVTAHLPRVLADLVTVVGRDLSATPVAGPPYVVVSGRGPVVRATLSDGRLVVCLAVFAVERGPTYRRRDGVVVDAALR